jgi:hypothetical protein
MPSNLENQLEEERARIVALDSKLDVKLTPNAKAELRLALNFLDDTKTALRGFKGDTSNADWVKLATFSLQRATEKRQAVQEATHNGDSRIIEMGG